MATQGKSISCRAAVIRKFNEPITIETIEVSAPKNGEIRVKMLSVGLCHSDLCILNGTYPSQPLPCVPGHEGAGIVESVGPGVTAIKQGDKVLTLFLPQCRQCRTCNFRRSNTCNDTLSGGGLLGRARMADGTTRFTSNGQPLYHLMGSSSFSEYTVIPQASCVKIDPKTNVETACIIACGFSTGYGSSANCVQIEEGDSTAVWAMGGVGLATVMGCKDKKASKIIAVDVTNEKEAMAKKKGATHFLSLDSLKKPVDEVIKDLTDGKGVDFAFVCIGNTKAMESAVSSLNPGGTLVIVGVAAEDAQMQIQPSYMLCSRKIVGSLIGDYKILDDLPKLIDRYNAGKLPIDDFITHRFQLDQINDAVQLMKQGKSIRSVIQMASAT
ncbi:NAD/NADP dependent alcohol dehydrogenase [Chamberlinius hualienensis]